MEEPGHKAMLYFLEVLMNSNGSLTISQLAGRFGSRTFTPEMRSACGGNEAGLKKFLQKFPSLFTITGNMVFLCDGQATAESDGNGDTSSNEQFKWPDVSQEMAAVQYFKQRLSKKEDRWVLVKSLAGHLSQASADIRGAVGPQLEFRRWLLKHPHIFEVQGDLVGLRDGVDAMASPGLHHRHFDLLNEMDNTLPESKILPPRTPPATRRVQPKSPAPLRRSYSFGEKRALQHQQQQPVSFISPLSEPLESPLVRRRQATNPGPITLTSSEYKAVMFIKELIEKKGSVRLHNIVGQLPENIRNLAGWTNGKVEEFLRRHGNVFIIGQDDIVQVNKQAKVNAVITGSRPLSAIIMPTPPSPISIIAPPTQPSTPTTPMVGPRNLTHGHGKVFHVARLWGIIDLGHHEHVFFDKSIMHGVEDMQKYFQPGEILHFHATLAPKSSRAKWRATHVWREKDGVPIADPVSETSGCDGPALSPSLSIEDEINRYLPRQGFDNQDAEPVNVYSDGAPSAAGVVPVWSLSDSPHGKHQLTMMPESYHMNSSALSDLIVSSEEQTKTKTAVINGELKSPIKKNLNEKKYVDSMCQTIATGDIIATQLFED